MKLLCCWGMVRGVWRREVTPTTTLQLFDCHSKYILNVHYHEARALSKARAIEP